MTYKLLFAGVLALLIFVSPASASDKVYVDLQQENVVEFIEEMVTTHDFDRDALSAVLAKAEIKATIIKKISTPAERKIDLGRVPQDLHHQGTHQCRCNVLA